MRLKLITFSSLLTLLIIIISSCSSGQTYAKMKEKERDAINNFLQSNKFVGPITVISEETFNAQGDSTSVQKNEFVLFNDKGIYMQIVRRGNGRTMIEMAKDQPDSTITKTICCRFFEYDIENADTTCANIYQTQNGVVDKMQCQYTHQSRSYIATFIEGKMLTYYTSSAAVPTGWLKPLDYIKLAKSEGAGEVAKVRLIVPHSSGTYNAGNYVLPFYYEITYQLGK